MKGLFIPEITTEMFRNGCLESIEALMTEGEIYDIEYLPWIPVSERLPEETGWYLVTFKGYKNMVAVYELSYRKPENYWTDKDISKKVLDNSEVIAWMPLPEPYKTESEG